MTTRFAFAVILTLAACGPSSRTGNPVVFVDPAGLSPLEVSQVAFTVFSGLAHQDVPGWFFTVSPYPVQLPSPEINPFNGDPIDTATSFTDFNSHHVALSWQRTPAGLVVQDLPYELANITCGCESGLRKAGP